MNARTTFEQDMDNPPRPLLPDQLCPTLDRHRESQSNTVSRDWLVF
jgi:hypothetical protein